MVLLNDINQQPKGSTAPSSDASKIALGRAVGTIKNLKENHLFYYLLLSHNVQWNCLIILGLSSQTSNLDYE